MFHTGEATSLIRESSLISSLIPTQVLVVPLLLVLVLLVVLYLRVPNGNTEEPAQTSLRSVSVLVLDRRSSTVDAHGRESLQSPIRIQDPGLMNDSVLEFTTGTRITECSTCTGTLPI